uniref:Activin types I and II receptor domain-containing protein n=1 Tax=Anopheles farauti TaxID=69004 RepID=A0A182Q3S0_9DIPT
MIFIHPSVFVFRCIVRNIIDIDFPSSLSCSRFLPCASCVNPSASTIHRHTADDNDTSAQAKDQQQPPTNAAGKHSSENFPSSAASNTGGAGGLAPASLQAASPQTMTLTAEKNKTKLLKCHCDICRDENFVCETDGVCFTSLTRESDGKLKYSYR